MSDTNFNTIPEAIEEIRKGRMLVVVDDPGRENEGDVIMAAEKCTEAHVNFMTLHARGLLCVPMLGRRLDELKIGPMVDQSPAGSTVPGRDTAFTVSVDLKRGTTTGISAGDRARTIRALVHPRSQPEDFIRPGHIFPLRAKDGGVLVRAGHTEATVDLARLAGLKPVGVLLEILNLDGTMARVPQLKKFAKKHKLKMITIESLIEYRRKHERLVERRATAALPTKFGDFTLHLYEERLSGKQHLALVKGEPNGQKDVLVRVHSSCITGDTLASLRCDCGDQLQHAMKRIAQEERGVLLYLNQEGRGIGLFNKIRSYGLQDTGLDTVQANQALGFKADLREYGIGAQVLADLGLTTIRILTNNPRKIVGIEGYGLKVTGRVAIQMPAHAHNARYLETKRKKLGHLIDLKDGPHLSLRTKSR
ncbi:MAG: bifunctional 3,4-dihydroxy-2-butanone-4-phosphate synthase/GTP cyclohydrolase II [Proteobacteria bacterium]|nr:bifunctional 3,4-dihydroxy-2-butanone-4-phosphate synthase/GTP cyclohydrolase II [Pseudomonadota bacterium]